MPKEWEEGPMIGYGNGPDMINILTGGVKFHGGVEITHHEDGSVTTRQISPEEAQAEAIAQAKKFWKEINKTKVE